MRRSLLVLSLLFAACGGPKAEVTDDFSDLGDEKADSFSKKMSIVSTLADPQGDVQINYKAKPIYRAIKIHALAGDWVKISVHGEGTGVGQKIAPGMIIGDPVTFLLDSRYRIVAKNDDVMQGTPDSQIVVQLRKGGTFYVVVRDYNYDTVNFGALIRLARASGDLIADANSWFQFFVADDEFGTITEGYAISMDQMPQAAQDDANGFFKHDVGGAGGYAFPYGGDVMYMLLGSAEEAYDARPYDASGNPICETAIGGDVGDIHFGPAVRPQKKGASDVDPNAAGVALKYGFQQFYKCGDDSDIAYLGNQVTMGACLVACQATQAAGCWYLDGTGGFPHDCRACMTLTPVKMSWANDWARALP